MCTVTGQLHALQSETVGVQAGGVGGDCSLEAVVRRAAEAEAAC